MQIRTIPVGELGTNCYLISGSDGAAAIIDPGDDAEVILSAVGDLRVECVLLTHVHFDHIMALPAVLETTGAALYVPALEADALSDPIRSLFALLGGYMPQCPAPDRLLKEGDTVTVGQELALSVLHTPGHTPGSSCYMTDGVIFTGDTLFAGTVGRTDFPGGDTDTLLRSLSRLSALPGDYTLYPGHNAATTLSRERQYNPYLRGRWEGELV